LTIVNQTVPRALRLGYDHRRSDEIVAYIDERRQSSAPAPRRRAPAGVRLLDGRQRIHYEATCG
jgi:hypothetical protein